MERRKRVVLWNENFVTSTPSVSHPHSCTSCTAGQTFKPQPGQDACTAVRECQRGFTESIAPTTTTDRKCTPCPPDTYKSMVGSQPCSAVTYCTPGQEQLLAANSTMNTQCRPCVLGSLYDHDLDPLTACIPVRFCNSAQEESVAPTTTSNRQCRNCPSGQTFQAPARKQQCVRQCSSKQRELSAPTFTSDRVCETKVAITFEADYHQLITGPQDVANFLSTVRSTLASLGVNIGALPMTASSGSIVVTVAADNDAVVEELLTTRCNGFTVNFKNQIIASRKQCSTSATTGGNKSSASQTWVVAVAVVATVVVVALGVLLYRRRREAHDTLHRAGPTSFSNPMYDVSAYREDETATYNPVYDTPKAGPDALAAATGQIADRDGFYSSVPPDANHPPDATADGFYNTISPENGDFGEEGVASFDHDYDLGTQQMAGDVSPYHLASSDHAGDGDHGYMEVHPQESES